MSRPFPSDSFRLAAGLDYKTDLFLSFLFRYNKVDHPIAFSTKSTEKPKKLGSGGGGGGEAAPDFEGVQVCLFLSLTFTLADLSALLF